MRIAEMVRQCVVHLYQKAINDESGTSLEPAGTGFLVAVPILSGNEIAVHLVTARHLVYATRASGGIFARFNTKDGGFKDLHVPPDDWVSHQETDVAAAPVKYDPEYDLAPLPVTFFATDEYVATDRIGEGDDVCFVGLFNQFPGRTQNQPITRFGKI